MDNPDVLIKCLYHDSFLELIMSTISSSKVDIHDGSVIGTKEKEKEKKKKTLQRYSA